MHYAFFAVQRSHFWFFVGRPPGGPSGAQLLGLVVQFLTDQCVLHFASLGASAVS